MTTRKIILFDGPDGCGKTTQLQLVAQTLEQQGQQIFGAHMLGGSPIGHAVRNVILSDMERPALTNLHLALSAYYALLEVIEEKVAAGHTVLIDRSPLSLIAYQVFGDKLDETIGFAACTETMQAFQPSAVIVYNAPLEVLQSRREKRQKIADHFEKLPIDYHKSTVEGYAAAAKRYSTTIIDASADIDTVHAQTMQIVNSVLGLISVD